MDIRSKETHKKLSSLTWITLQQQIFKNAVLMLHWSFSTRNVDNTTFLPMYLFYKTEVFDFQQKEDEAKRYEVIASMLVLLLAI